MQAANRAVDLAPREVLALEVAVAVAQAAGDAATAVRHLQAALQLRPGDITIRRALGISLDQLHRHAEAEPHWRAIVAALPNDASALGWLGDCLIRQDKKDEARIVLERASQLAPEHPNLPFHLAIARGETPATQPQSMVQQFFDGYASTFDQHLRDLQYNVPERVAQMIREWRPRLDVSVLDLGCGTGLLGQALGTITGGFVGVDLSPKMIEQTALRGVYTELHTCDLMEQLRRTEPASFDYVVANDVFIYVGDLSEIIPGAFAALRNGGSLIFSCETASESESELVLRSSKRYAHAKNAVQRLCRDAGFGSFSAEDIALRLDRVAGTIDGFIAVARKP
jgi:predicted TPR repeat methyltransferase